MILNNTLKVEDSTLYLDSISVYVLANDVFPEEYIKDPQVSCSEDFYYIYSESRFNNIVKRVNSPLLAAFICYRSSGWPELNVKIEKETKTIGEWHEYFMESNVELYISKLKEFQYYDDHLKQFKNSFDSKYHHLF